LHEHAILQQQLQLPSGFHRRILSGDEKRIPSPSGA
jgi:hypothetical protein